MKSLTLLVLDVGKANKIDLSNGMSLDKKVFCPLELLTA